MYSRPLPPLKKNRAHWLLRFGCSDKDRNRERGGEREREREREREKTKTRTTRIENEKIQLSVVTSDSQVTFKMG